MAASDEFIIQPEHGRVKEYLGADNYVVVGHPGDKITKDQAKRCITADGKPLIPGSDPVPVVKAVTPIAPAVKAKSSYEKPDTPTVISTWPSGRTPAPPAETPAEAPKAPPVKKSTPTKKA